MKHPASWMLLPLLVGSLLPARGALVFVDLSSVPAYQNQSTPAPSPPVGGVNTSSSAVSISNIAVGSGTYSLDLTISDSLGSSGLVEKFVRLDSRLNDVELIFSPGPPEQVTALAPGAVVDAGAAWYTTSDKSLPLTRHLVILGSPTDQGQWTDGQVHFAGFRFMDGASYHYGFVGLTITSFDSTPTLSISGYAYETTPDQAVTIGAIPEPATTAVLFGAGGLMLVASRRVRRRGPEAR